MNKIFICLYLALAIVIANCSGQPTEEDIQELTADEIKKGEKILPLSLSKLSEEDKDFKLKLVKIHSGTIETIKEFGMRFKLKADFTNGNDDNAKACDVTILTQPKHDNGIEFTFECEGMEKIVKTHSGYLSETDRILKSGN
ncbi:hypothetical protein DOY81_008306 [Sarcophaga bullata]|nr:hypothetical protein DOY81_008306 [Sarcophaga bullata]